MKLTINATIELDKDTPMITAAQVNQLIDALKTALLAESNDAAALASAQQTIANLQQTVADLNDPALAQSISDTLAAASAANPAPAAPATPAPATT
jgi:hypothetical protein